MQTKPLETKLSVLIADDLAAMGYNLVRVQMMSGGRYVTLQVMAERVDEKPMTVNDCAQISHHVSEKLDADPELTSSYTLEVSSPGIDRPLMQRKDFERFTGHVACIDLSTPQEGQRRFQGSIVRVSGQDHDTEIELHTATGDKRVPMSAISRARLVFTDALMNTKPGTKH